MSVLRSLLMTLLLGGAVASVPFQAPAQCLIANPSFEVTGSGAVFGGWNGFGNVGSTPVADHGQLAARVTSPNTGDWAMSGFWQPLDCAVGEQFVVTGHVLNPSASPLGGGSAALVNVNWMDAGGAMIDYDTHTVALAGSAQDEYLAFEFTSAAAPTGTASAQLLFGNLQGPGDPVSDVYFDQLTFDSTTSPTLDEVQWNDFPSGRVVDFAGRAWRVKGTGYYGPGPNLFSAGADQVWVDEQDALHLTLSRIGGNWYSTEVVLDEALGYGDYVLTTRGALDLLDPQAVLGLFLWQYQTCYDDAFLWWNAYNEIDIEYSRWQDPADDLVQFVAQPYYRAGNLHRFDAVYGADEIVSHAMRWLPDRVEYRVWRGPADAEATSPLVQAWTYAGPHIPRPEQPRLHLNLWRIPGADPQADQEVVFTDFAFTPAAGASAIPAPEVPRRNVAEGRLLPAVPNPFNPSTTLRFELARSGLVELAVYSLDGRRVRSVFSGTLEAGVHERSWDGRGETGRPAASGVYLVRLRTSHSTDLQRILLLK